MGGWGGRGGVFEKASELGLYIGLLPTWGDKFNKKWGGWSWRFFNSSMLGLWQTIIANDSFPTTYYLILGVIGIPKMKIIMQ